LDVLYTLLASIQDYDQLSATCFETIYSDEHDIISMTSCPTLLYFQNMLFYWQLITFLGMGDRLDATNSKMAQQFLLPHHVT